MQGCYPRARGQGSTAAVRPETRRGRGVRCRCCPRAWSGGPPWGRCLRARSGRVRWGCCPRARPGGPRCTSGRVRTVAAGVVSRGRGGNRPVAGVAPGHGEDGSVAGVAEGAASRAPLRVLPSRAARQGPLRARRSAAGRSGMRTSETSWRASLGPTASNLAIRRRSTVRSRSLCSCRMLRDRFHGASHRSGEGDAVARPRNFARPGTFTPVGDMLGGGPFDLPGGAWSDDTSMALVWPIASSNPTVSTRGTRWSATAAGSRRAISPRPASVSESPPALPARSPWPSGGARLFRLPRSQPGRPRAPVASGARRPVFLRQQRPGGRPGHRSRPHDVPVPLGARSLPQSRSRPLRRPVRTAEGRCPREGNDGRRERGRRCRRRQRQPRSPRGWRWRHSRRCRRCHGRRWQHPRRRSRRSASPVAALAEAPARRPAPAQARRSH